MLALSSALPIPTFPFLCPSLSTFILILPSLVFIASCLVLFLLIPRGSSLPCPHHPYLPSSPSASPLDSAAIIGVKGLDANLAFCGVLPTWLALLGWCLRCLLIRQVSPVTLAVAFRWGRAESVSVPRRCGEEIPSCSYIETKGYSLCTVAKKNHCDSISQNFGRNRLHFLT